MREWRSCVLGEVAEFVRGITFKPDDVVPFGTADSVVCMRTKNVQKELDTSDMWSVNKSFAKRSNQLLQAGDILISSANSWNLVGKCCWVPQLPWPASFGGFVSVLRAHTEEVDSRFLFRWFSSDRVQSIVRSFGRQTTNISNLDISRCLRLELPLPPLAEQRQIAELLDRADAVRATRREALAQLDDLTNAIFVDKFGDPASNPKGWPEDLRLGDVADIASGVTVGRKIRGADTYSVPYLAVVNVQDRRLDLSRVKMIEATKDEIERYQLKEGDLLLTEGGDPDKLGRGALWKEEIVGCIHQNHVFRVRLKSDNILPTFLNWIVGSSRGKRYFLRSAKQTTGIASINMTQLRSFPLVVPPIDLQHEFARRVEAVERLKASHRAHLAELDALFASLQYRAFRGEL